MNWTGLWLGLFMLGVIGFGFFWVIKLEYYVGAHVWPVVLGVGIGLAVFSLFLPSFWLSALVGIFAGSVIWGSTELPDQAIRVQRGLFPANPKRQARQRPKEMVE